VSPVRKPKPVVQAPARVTVTVKRVEVYDPAGEQSLVELLIELLDRRKHSG